MCTVFVALALFEYAIVIKVKYNSTTTPGGHCRSIKVHINTDLSFRKYSRDGQSYEYVFRSLTVCLRICSHYRLARLWLSIGRIYEDYYSIYVHL